MIVMFIRKKLKQHYKKLIKQENKPQKIKKIKIWRK